MGGGHTGQGEDILGGGYTGKGEDIWVAVIRAMVRIFWVAFVAVMGLRAGVRICWHGVTGRGEEWRLYGPG